MIVYPYFCQSICLLNKKNERKKKLYNYEWNSTSKRVRNNSFKTLLQFGKPFLIFADSFG